jgi:hypothetical protein
MQGLGCRVQGLGCRVQGLGCRVQILRFEDLHLYGMAWVFLYQEFRGQSLGFNL